MADHLNNEIQPTQPVVLRQRRSKIPGALALVAMAAAAGYLWLNHDRLVQVIWPAAHPTAVAAPVVGNAEVTVTLKDFRSFQQQTNDSMQSTAQDVAALQGSLKTLSDQFTALSERIDALQSAPGLITGASDDDPSGIATYSQAGAQFGFSITWTLLFT